VYDLLIAFSKCLTERHAHIRQQSESVGLSCPSYIYLRAWFNVAAEP
jgi:hypothetical protein